VDNYGENVVGSASNPPNSAICVTKTNFCAAEDEPRQFSHFKDQAGEPTGFASAWVG